MTTFIEIGEQIVNPAHIVRIRCEHAFDYDKWHWKFDLVDGMTATLDSTWMDNTALMIDWLNEKMHDAIEEQQEESEEDSEEDLPPVPGMDAGEVK